MAVSTGKTSIVNQTGYPVNLKVDGMNFLDLKVGETRSVKHSRILEKGRKRRSQPTGWKITVQSYQMSLGSSNDMMKMIVVVFRLEANPAGVLELGALGIKENWRNRICSLRIKLERQQLTRIEIPKNQRGTSSTSGEVERTNLTETIGTPAHSTVESSRGSNGLDASLDRIDLGSSEAGSSAGVTDNRIQLTIEKKELMPLIGARSTSLVTNSIIDSFEKYVDRDGMTWRLVNVVFKNTYWDEFKKRFWWEPSLSNKKVYALWKKKAGTLYQDLVGNLKKERPTCPPYIVEDIWVDWCKYWDAVEKSEKAKKNRFSEPDGPSTGFERHRGSSSSAVALAHAAELENEDALIADLSQSLPDGTHSISSSWESHTSGIVSYSSFQSRNEEEAQSRAQQERIERMQAELLALHESHKQKEHQLSEHGVQITQLKQQIERQQEQLRDRHPPHML